jgi:hypothetical protein
MSQPPIGQLEFTLSELLTARSRQLDRPLVGREWQAGQVRSWGLTPCPVPGCAGLDCGAPHAAAQPRCSSGGCRPKRPASPKQPNNRADAHAQSHSCALTHTLASLSTSWRAQVQLIAEESAASKATIHMVLAAQGLANAELLSQSNLFLEVARLQVGRGASVEEGRLLLLVAASESAAGRHLAADPGNLRIRQHLSSAAAPAHSSLLHWPPSAAAMGIGASIAAAPAASHLPCPALPCPAGGPQLAARLQD